MQAALGLAALVVIDRCRDPEQRGLQSKGKVISTRCLPGRKPKTSPSRPSTARPAAQRLRWMAQLTVPTSFLGVIGYQNINVNASSTAAWGSSRLRVALVLDNTGSMRLADKMAALKSAIKRAC